MHPRPAGPARPAGLVGCMEPGTLVRPSRPSGHTTARVPRREISCQYPPVILEADMTNPIRGFMDVAQRAAEAARRTLESARTQAKSGNPQEASAAGGAQKPATAALFNDGFSAQQDVKVNLSGGTNSVAQPQNAVEAQQSVSQLTPEQQVRASQEAVEVASVSYDDARRCRRGAGAAARGAGGGRPAADARAAGGLRGGLSPGAPGHL
jgi:hypothetical protein